MHRTQCRHLLLIQPPFHHPAYAPPAWLRIAAAADAFAEHVSLHDAGLDYFNRTMGEPGWLRNVATAADLRSLPELQDHHPMAPAEATAVTDDWSDALQRLRSNAFFEPACAKHDLELFDRVLALASAAYPSCRFHREGFSHASLNTAEDVIDLARDAQANPFWEYAYRLWQPFSGCADPDVTLVCVTSSGQALAAATLVQSWRRRWPDRCIRLYATEKDALGLEAVFTKHHDPPDIAALADTIVSGIRSSSVPSGGRPADWPAPAGGYLAPMDPTAGGPVIVSGHADPVAETDAGDADSAAIEAAVAAGRSLVVWSGNPGDDKDSLIRALYAASRKGLWNHVILTALTDDPLVQFAKANPNIIHSWCRRHPPLSPFSDPVDQLPDRTSTYGQTPSLPGQPVWKILRDPVYIEAYARHYGVKPLVRLRLHGDGRRHYRIGSGLVYRYVQPAEVSEDTLDRVVEMIAAGGSVDLNYVRYNLKRAFLIALAEEQDVLVGNSCLKHPRSEYTEAVSRQIGLDLTGYLERGYTSVRPEYRGLGVGAKLLEGLTQRSGSYKIFSVIAEGHTATQKMAIRNRTRRVATFFSERTQKQIGIWIPEWMLPEDLELPPQPELDS
jgi:GNAT superfamily N-acetyltransferase